MQYQTRINEFGQYQVYGTENGIRKTDVGPPFGTPGGAGAYLDDLQKQADKAAAELAAEWKDD